MGVLKYAIVGASFASMALASPHVKRGTVAADGKIWTSCVDPGVISLTFDDGPYIYTQSIVDQLTAAGHQATFFQNGKLAQLEMEKGADKLLGQNWDSIYNYNDTLKSMISGGHQIGSHT
jgi:peptidoglycan/xylan/chitin deacetylase (PgdA/CDA1 family)